MKTSGELTAKVKIKDKLLNVATRLFSERGFNGVSIREISRVSDVSISMISYHFGGKERLYSFILKELFSCYDYVDELELMNSKPLDKIKNYILWSLSKHRGNDCFTKIYINELVNKTKFYDSIAKPLVSKSYNALFNIVEEGKADGSFRTDIDSNALAIMICTAINNVTFYECVDTKIRDFASEDINIIADSYMEIVKSGICMPGTAKL